MTPRLLEENTIPQGLAEQDALAVCHFHHEPPEHTCPDGLPGVEGAYESHPQVAIIYMCVALLTGVLTQHLLSRYLPSLAYTCAMLILGIIFGVVHEETRPSRCCRALL